MIGLTPWIKKGSSQRLLLAMLVLAFPMLALAQEGSDPAQREVTWAGDVAAIFQQKCQECHRPNSIAPMSLLTYDQAKMFAPIIRYRV